MIKSVTTKEDKHTELPWWVDDDGFVASGSGDTYVTVAETHCTNDLDTGEMDANAEFICLAVNNHARLVQALKDLHACHRAFSANNNWTSLDDDARVNAEAALAAAGE